MKIEKNIIMPPDIKGPGVPKSKYGTVMYESMVHMEVGDSVRFDSKREAKLAIAAMDRVRKLGHTPAETRYSYRHVIENGNEFARVWRTH